MRRAAFNQISSGFIVGNQVETTATRFMDSPSGKSGAMAGGPTRTSEQQHREEEKDIRDQADVYQQEAGTIISRDPSEMHDSERSDGGCPDVPPREPSVQDLLDELWRIRALNKFDKMVIKNLSFVNHIIENKSIFMHLCERGELQIATEAVPHVSDINAICAKDGRTALHMACSEQHVDIAEMLVEEGARMDIRDYTHLKPLDLLESDRHRARIREACPAFVRFKVRYQFKHQEKVQIRLRK
jgi:Ankyrin repeats (3 copies)